MEKTRKKIVLVAHQSNMYGASQCLYVVASSLRQYDIGVVCPEDGPLVDALLSSGIQTVVISKFPAGRAHRASSNALDLPAKLVYRVLYFFSLVAFLGRYSPDLVIVNTLLNSGAVLACRLLGIPAVLYFHEYRWSLSRLNPLRTWIDLHLPDRFIAVSRAVKELLVQEGVPSTKIEIVHNGVLVRNSEIGRESLELRHKWSGTSDATILGLIGVIDPRKDLMTAIEAVSIVSSHGMPLKLIILGETIDREGNQYLEKVKQRIEELDLAELVIFEGFQPDVTPWLKSFDVLVVASRDESFCLVAAEAMMMSKPVVATRVGGLPEVVLDGETGLLVDPGSPDALAGAIQKLMDSPSLRKEMGNAGRKHALAMFTRDQYIAQVEDVVAEMLGQAGPNP